MAERLNPTFNPPLIPNSFSEEQKLFFRSLFDAIVDYQSQSSKLGVHLDEGQSRGETFMMREDEL